MRVLFLPCFAVPLLAFTGCSTAYSTNPLHKADDVVQAAALEGSWTAVNPADDPPLCVENFPDQGYVLVLSDPDTKVLSVYSIDLVELDAHLYADLVARGQIVHGDELDMQPGSVTPHIIATLDVGDNSLDWSVLSADAIKEQNKDASSPMSYIEAGDDLILSSETDELRQYVSTNSDRIFGSRHHYIRQANPDPPDSATTACGIPTQYLTHNAGNTAERDVNE
ncbi:MAG TPA: hypothetical protein VGJ21_10400 [Terracidiphilus sp.]|jgi:hypothetical protein